MKIVVKSLKKCMKCNVDNKQADLYICPKHKKIFCLSCMTNKYRQATRFNKCAHCEDTYFLGEFYNKKYYAGELDCIYQKLPQIKEEDEEK